MAQGKFGGGNGLINDPYLIEDIADLNQIRVNPSLHYKLKYSINAGVIPYNEGNGWNPITNFTGTLNGNGKKIFNLYINRPNEDDVGLFRTLQVTDATENIPAGLINYTKLKIYDLGLENVNIVGRNNVGGFVGQIVTHASGNNNLNFDFLLKRIYVTGNVKGSSAVASVIGTLNLQTFYINSYDYYNNYRHNMFGDIYVNTDIIASNANTNYASIVGRIVKTNQGNRYGSNGVQTWLNANGATFMQNVVSNCRFVSSINGLIAHTIYGQNDGVSGTVKQTYYNSDNWPTLHNNAGVVALTTEQMKRSTYLGTIVEQVNDFDLSQRTWTFERGRYPQLYFAIADNLFIKAGENYYGLDSDGNLELKFTMLPTREEAVDKGIKDISEVSNAVWNELKEQYETVEIVNIIERSSNVQNIITTHLLDLDDDNSSESKLVYRKEFNFTDFHDGISLIRTV